MSLSSILSPVTAVSNAASGLVGLAQGFQSSFIGASAAEREAMQFNADEAEKSRAFNASEAEKSRLFNSAEAQAQRDWTEQQYLAHESIGAKVAEAKAAGINPAAIYGGITSGGVGSGSAASGSAASGSAASGSAGNMQLDSRINPDTIRDSLMLDSNMNSLRRVNEANARIYEANADVAEYEANVAKAKNNPTYISTEINQALENVKASIANANANAKLAQERTKNELQSRKIEKARWEYSETLMKLDILQSAYGVENFQTRLELENEKLRAEAMLDKAVAARNYEEIDKVRAEIKEIEQKCITLGEQAYNLMIDSEFKSGIETRYRESGIDVNAAIIELTNEKSESERVMRPVNKFKARAEAWNALLNDINAGYDFGIKVGTDVATRGTSAVQRNTFALKRR